MAHPLSAVTELLIESVAAVAAAWRRGAIDRAGLMDVVRDHVRPQRGVELVVPDGALVTGVVVVHDNLPVLMIVARHDPPPRRWSQPEPLAPPGPTALRVWDDEYPNQ